MTTSPATIAAVALDLIDAGDNDRTFTEATIADLQPLADSMRTLGVLEPIIVRPMPTLEGLRYQLATCSCSAIVLRWTTTERRWTPWWRTPLASSMERAPSIGQPNEGTADGTARSARASGTPASLSFEDFASSGGSEQFSSSVGPSTASASPTANGTGRSLSTDRSSTSPAACSRSLVSNGQPLRNYSSTLLAWNHGADGGLRVKMPCCGSTLEFSPTPPSACSSTEAARAFASDVDRSTCRLLDGMELPGLFELVAGERRTRAARLAGLATIPAMIRDLSDLEASDIMLVENVNRADLDVVDEATAYQKRMDREGLTATELAARIGLSWQRVATRVRLLKLVPEALHLVRLGQLDQSSALLLADLDANRQRLALAALADGMAIKALNALCRRLANEAAQESMFDTDSFLRVEEYRLTAEAETTAKLTPAQLRKLVGELAAALADAGGPAELIAAARAVAA